MNPASASIAGQSSSPHLQSPPTGINQMLEIFKFQYLMGFLGQSGGSGQQAKGIAPLLIIMLWDQFAKYVPNFIALLTLFFQAQYYRLTGKSFNHLLTIQPLTIQDNVSAPVTLPPQKSIKAFIQYERNPAQPLVDARIDAVIHHICNLPEVRSLRFNGYEMIPNFKDALMIDTDIWFELIQSPGGGGMMSAASGSPFSTGSNAPKPLEPIFYKLSTYDHDIKWLHQFVERTIEAYEAEKKNKLGNEMYYFDHMTGTTSIFQNRSSSYGCVFQKSKFQSNRSLKNVYLKQIDELQERVDFFLHRRDWYDTKGVPYTLGIVMYGHPGCGKTSTIKAIANEARRHIFNVSLSEIKTKTALKDLFYSDIVTVMEEGSGGASGKPVTLNIPLKQRIYVIEDIDAMDSIVVKRSPTQVMKEAEQREKEKKIAEEAKMIAGAAAYNKMVDGVVENKDLLDLSTLLNVLDGVRETPGRIIILSTNYPERLDEALLRPGRFDLMLEFEKHSLSVLRLHIERYYDVELTAAQWGRLNRHDIDKKWTPAEVSQILFKHLMNIDAAISDICEKEPAELFKFSQMGNGGGQDCGTLLDSWVADAQHHVPLDRASVEQKIEEKVIEEEQVVNYGLEATKLEQREKEYDAILNDEEATLADFSTFDHMSKDELVTLIERMHNKRNNPITLPNSYKETVKFARQHKIINHLLKVKYNTVLDYNALSMSEDKKNSLGLAWCPFLDEKNKNEWFKKITGMDGVQQQPINQEIEQELIKLAQSEKHQTKFLPPFADDGPTDLDSLFELPSVSDWIMTSY